MTSLRKESVTPSPPPTHSLRKRNFPPIMAPSRGKRSLRPGPLLSLRARPEPLHRDGSETFSHQLANPLSCRLVAFSTSARSGDSAPIQADNPPHAHIPQQLVARPLSAPRGCPSAGNLHAGAAFFPAPPPLHCARKSAREGQTGRRRRGGRWLSALAAGSRVRARPLFTVLPRTQEEEAATALCC